MSAIGKASGFPDQEDATARMIARQFSRTQFLVVNDRLAEHPLTRGNLRRTAGCVPICVSFRTSPQTGVGISLVIETTFFFRWGLPRQERELARNDREFGFAMTGNSIVRC